MRFFMLLTLAFFSYLIAPGCGDGRPDPRDNPDFDEEAFNDPDAIKMDTLK